jgi:predicted lysophospholipase L1 biosynthesis ABC-type transport system permease subunit
VQLRPPAASPLTFNAAVQSPQPTPPISVTVIGVAPDIRQSAGDVAPTVYLPFRGEAPAGVTLIVRGSGGRARVVSAARNATNALDPDLALGVVRTLDELRDRSRSLWTGMASQFAKIAVLALVLSGVGLYSAIAYAVKRRTQEIAIRTALGAPVTHVRWLFLRTGAWVVLGGLVLGVPASFAVGRLLQNNMMRTDAIDVGTLAVTVALLWLVAVAASGVPARRASRRDPGTALRVD